MARTSADLQGIRVRCKYRGINSSDVRPVRYSFDLRLEVAGSDSYNARADLGRYSPTQEWQTIDTDLGDVKNCQEFLKAISDYQPDSFKLVWSQVGNGSANRSGDTLLIDDIEFFLPPGKQESDYSIKPAPETKMVAQLEDAGTASALDLTQYYSMKASQFRAEKWFPWPGVPQGSQVFANVPLEIGGSAFLWGARNAEAGTDYPKQIVIAEVPKRFESLYICHSLFYEGPKDSPVCSVTIQYADGTSSSDTIRCGADGLDWFVKSNESIVGPSSKRSVLAWQGESPYRDGKQMICYCLTRIDNPNPNQEVKSIRLESSKTATAISILAITAGKTNLMTRPRE
jgi:hypothetical protein